MSSENLRITGRHIAAARELLDITQEQLAQAAGVSRVTLARLEKAQHIPRDGTLDKIREALERRGIEFMNGDRPGVRHQPDRAIIPQ